MEVILTVGLPASGKTTWANEWKAESPINRVIVCKDDIRMSMQEVPCTRMLVFDKTQEKQVQVIQRALLSSYLEAGMDICIADTHLNEGTRTGTINFIKDSRQWHEGKVEITTKDFTAVPLWECLHRDAKRANNVGETVIISMWDRYLKDQHNIVTDKKDSQYLRPCFVFDLDGTLADKGKRSPYDYSKVSEDTVIDSVKLILSMAQYSNCVEIIFASGRPESCREDSEKWIQTNVTTYSWKESPVKLLMRATEDRRPDWKVKEEMLTKIMTTNKVMGWFDDRWQVTAHLRSLGVPVFNVAFGRF